jgi:hypothetical protein
MVSYPFVISVCRFTPPQADLARWKGILSNFVCNPAMAGANGQNLVSREHFNLSISIRGETQPSDTRWDFEATSKYITIYYPLKIKFRFWVFRFRPALASCS